VHTGIKGNEEGDEAGKESLEQEVETTHKRTGLVGQEKKCLKKDKRPGWNQRVKWLGENISTLVSRASNDDNKSWYRGLGWDIQI
jgi:hypothetical protein